MTAGGRLFSAKCGVELRKRLEHCGNGRMQVDLEVVSHARLRDQASAPRSCSRHYCLI
jgi:hypothetical protein